MARRYVSEEEMLARKLVGFLVTTAVMLAFAGVVYYVISTPPEIEPQAAPPDAARSTDASVETFKDRIAQVQLGGWALATRKGEARRLLAAAPTPELRREAEKLLKDIEQEERFDKLALFEGLRRSAGMLAAERRFADAELSLARFAKEHGGFDDDLAQLRKQFAAQREKAFKASEERAEEAIARGDVAAAEKLARETAAFATAAERPSIDAWAKRAEARRAERGATEIAQAPPDSPATGSDAPASEPPPGEQQDESPPGEQQEKSPGEQQDKPPGEPREKLPAAPAGEVDFAAVLVSRGGSFKADDGAELTLAAGKALVIADAIVDPSAFVETLRRGAPVWILGRPETKQGLLKPFGRTIQRRIEDLKLVVTGEEFQPDPVWEDETCRGRKWLLGKVELGFPVLRVSVNAETFLVAGKDLRVVQRTRLGSLPELTEGSAVFAAGKRTGGALACERIVVLPPDLASDPQYLRWCQ